MNKNIRKNTERMGELEEKKSILIIDDDESSCNTLTLIFNKLGFETEATGTGLGALHKIKNRFYNIALLDIKLPDIEGIELLSPLKEINPDMEVIMITAYATLEKAIRALNEGASAFITKPLNMDEVLAVIRKGLEKQRLIVEKRQAEKKLRKSEVKYRNAYDRVNFYKDIFTHDINNILQNLNSSIELLDLYKTEPKNIEKLNEVTQIFEDEIKRAINLVSNVRKLSDLEDNETPIKKIEVYQILNNIIKRFSQRYKNIEISIKLNSYSKELYVNANELLLDVFENILINAVKYNINPFVEIQIEISKEQKNSVKYLKFEFFDNGIGIPDVMKEKIFLGGFRRNKNVYGLGLGLSLVRKIITNYNGQIWVEDKVKGDYTKGSNFIILIPEES